jgi:hypothetical protein
MEGINACDEQTVAYVFTLIFKSIRDELFCTISSSHPPEVRKLNLINFVYFILRFLITDIIRNHIDAMWRWIIHFAPNEPSHSTFMIEFFYDLYFYFYLAANNAWQFIIYTHFSIPIHHPYHIFIEIGCCCRKTHVLYFIMFDTNDIIYCVPIHTRTSFKIIHNST